MYRWWEFVDPLIGQNRNRHAVATPGTPIRPASVVSYLTIMTIDD
jgi:hypothetical protein